MRIFSGHESHQSSVASYALASRAPSLPGEGKRRADARAKPDVQLEARLIRGGGQATDRGEGCGRHRAASGIGPVLTERLARAGPDVVPADVEQPALQAAEHKVAGLSAETLPAPTDVSDEGPVATARKACGVADAVSVTFPRRARRRPGPATGSSAPRAAGRSDARPVRHAGADWRSGASPTKTPVWPA
jgi:hypothetical protein